MPCFRPATDFFNDCPVPDVDPEVPLVLQIISVVAHYYLVHSVVMVLLRYIEPCCKRLASRAYWVAAVLAAPANAELQRRLFELVNRIAVEHSMRPADLVEVMERETSHDVVAMAQRATAPRAE